MYGRVGSMAFALMLTLCGAVHAQESASSGIVGQVTDATHAALPGVTVTVINVGTNAQRVATTDPDGRFSVPNLPPANYTIRVELTGFQTVELKEFTLRNGEVARPAITLGWPTSRRPSPWPASRRCSRRRAHRSARPFRRNRSRSCR
jgi:predicted RNA-binding protein with EMAP domain